MSLLWLQVCDVLAASSRTFTYAEAAEWTIRRTRPHVQQHSGELNLFHTCFEIQAALHVSVYCVTISVEVSFFRHAFIITLGISQKIFNVHLYFPCLERSLFRIVCAS